MHNRLANTDTCTADWPKCFVQNELQYIKYYLSQINHVLESSRSKVNSPGPSEVETALQLHFHLWRQSAPVYMEMYLLNKCILTKNSKYIMLLSYSQFSLQSINFFIFLSELLLNLGNPRIHLCLQTQRV